MLEKLGTINETQFDLKEGAMLVNGLSCLCGCNRPVFVNQGMTFCIEMYAFGYTNVFECIRGATDLF